MRLGVLAAVRPVRVVRLIASLASALALAGLCLPAEALAGTYTWSLPTDFTLTGANPDHDHYAGTPWTYTDGTSPTALARLDAFRTNVQGGLVAWTDSNEASALVGTNPQDQPIIGGHSNEDTFPPAQMVLGPTPTHHVAIRWTAPLPATTIVTGTIVSDETAGPARSACGSLGWDTWSLELNGAPVQGQSGTVPDSTQQPQAISASVPVAAGDTIDLVVAAGNGAMVDSACAPVAATFQIQATAPAPALTVDQPAPGTVISNGEPTFSGSASGAFGAQGTVTVRIYRGSAIDASTLAETLTVDRSGRAFSVSPDPFLYNGTYTVQAEQDDILGERGFSSPVTFTIADPLPPIALAGLGSKPLRSATPTFTGTAGTLPGDSAQIDVYIWSGTRARGYPARHLRAPRGPNGRWRIRVAPGLRDGRYVAIAAQNGPAGLIGSQFVRFQIKVRKQRKRHAERASVVLRPSVSPVLTGAQPRADSLRSRAS
jgi:hypothetical protein